MAIICVLNGTICSLADPSRARNMGAAGRELMLRDWALPALVGRLRGFLSGAAVATPAAAPVRRAG